MLLMYLPLMIRLQPADKTEQEEVDEELMALHRVRGLVSLL